MGALADAANASNNRAAVLGKIADLFERADIDPADVGEIKRASLWQGMSKGEDGEPVLTDMVGVQFSPLWQTGPAWPVVQPAPPTVIRHRAPRPRKTSTRVTVLLPDPQIGFLRYEDGTLDAIHDRRAMNCALSIIERVRPHRIVNLGDYLDLAEWSTKFAVLPEFVHTTQPAVVEGHRFLAEQQAAAGGQLEQHDLLEGNHDDRIPRLIMQNAKAAMRLKRADDPEGWPVMSVPNLLALDKLGVEYHDGYPAGRVKLTEAHGRQTALYALHGERLDMKQQAMRERQSTVQGHKHTFACHAETYEVEDRPVEVEAWSLGMLARGDGAVPSTRGGNGGRTGKPKVRQESWQQGVGILTETEDGWDLQPVRIRDGRAFVNGEVIVA